MAAVIDLNNRVPTGRFQLDASTYVGSYLVFNGSKPFSPGTETPLGVSSSAVGDTLGGRVGPFRALNSNGQSLSISDHIGNLGFLVSGSRQETDRRIDPPVPSLFHDHGYDYFLYGKFDYVLLFQFLVDSGMISSKDAHAHHRDRDRTLGRQEIISMAGCRKDCKCIGHGSEAGSDHQCGGFLAGGQPRCNGAAQ